MKLNPRDVTTTRSALFFPQVLTVTVQDATATAEEPISSTRNLIKFLTILSSFILIKRFLGFETAELVTCVVVYD